ncbi:hypothetical protein HK104_005688 [Borealophlyctis nickersoniae]|nr:hypothetical protein HK104_005688 [Borealophlyctis nickersoniae]
MWIDRLRIFLRALPQQLSSTVSIRDIAQTAPVFQVWSCDESAKMARTLFSRVNRGSITLPGSAFSQYFSTKATFGWNTMTRVGMRALMRSMDDKTDLALKGTNALKFSRAGGSSRTSMAVNVSEARERVAFGTAKSIASYYLQQRKSGNMQAIELTAEDALTAKEAEDEQKKQARLAKKREAEVDDVGDTTGKKKRKKFLKLSAEEINHRAAKREGKKVAPMENPESNGMADTKSESASAKTKSESASAKTNSSSDGAIRSISFRLFPSPELATGLLKWDNTGAFNVCIRPVVKEEVTAVDSCMDVDGKERSKHGKDNEDALRLVQNEQKEDRVPEVVVDEPEPIVEDATDAADVQMTPVPTPVNVQALQRHTTAVHTASEKSRRFTCRNPGCNTTFTHKCSLNRHSGGCKYGESTTQDRPRFSCPNAGCGGKFSRKDSLSRHAKKCQYRDVAPTTLSSPADPLPTHPPADTNMLPTSAPSTRGDASGGTTSFRHGE